MNFCREKWAAYFRLHGILFVFWSAKAATAVLEGKILPQSLNIQQDSTDPDTKVYGRDELLSRLQSEAEEIVSMRSQSRNERVVGDLATRSVIVGFVGYPNVGKSSTINALVGEKRTGVTSTPGKTKHFQTLIISEKLTLCDCPGLVFPSFTSSRYEMIASGVLPIDRMTEKREAVQIVCNRVPRSAIENVYKISLPKPKSYESQSRPPMAAEFMRAYCASRGYVASSGLPDETRAARQILKDFIDGKLPHYEMPPGMGGEDYSSETGLPDIHESGSSEEDDDDGPSVSQDKDLEQHALSDLKSFDLDNGLASRRIDVKKTKDKPYKQQKKPQRKKDRSWRVRDYGGGGDGMPVFQKAPNRGPTIA